MIHTYVPYLLLPYNKSIKVIEPISLKKRLIEVLSELIKFHEYDNFPDVNCQGSYIIISISIVIGVIWDANKKFFYMYLIQCRTGNMDI